MLYGFMHWLNVYEIPEGARVGKGKAIVNMIKIEPGEQIRAMLTQAALAAVNFNPILARYYMRLVE